VNDSSSQLKSRPTFTVDINRGGQTLSFLCSYLPNDYPNTREQHRELDNEQKQDNNQEDILEDFQIDEFTIHDGEWNETVYSSDCSVIDGELYDKLLNLLEEHGIGEGLFKIKLLFR
jgi:complement component 1 Q subcomponent-binding protein